MPKRQLILSVCLFAVATSGCGGSSKAADKTTPAAKAGDPSMVSSGAEANEPPEPEPAVNVAPEPPTPMYGSLVVNKVKNYETWKTAWDAEAAARKDAGLTGHMVMRGAADPNLVVIWLPTSDVQKAKTYLGNKELKDKLKQAGGQGKVDVTYSSLAGSQMDPKKQGLSGALLTAKVKDFGAFKTAFESGAQARTDAGIVGYGLSQDVTDKTVTYVYLQSEDPAKLKTYVDAKQTKSAWREAGVVGQAKVTLVQEGEMVMYP